MELSYLDKISTIKEALETVEELKIPEHLQEAAFCYLLGAKGNSHSNNSIATPLRLSVPVTRTLREYVASLNLKTAVVEIPSLLYWALTNEQLEATDEKGIVELYRRSGLRPPKNITQSLRDLASKKYGRLESVSNQPGFIKLSRVGEDFVIHDVLAKAQKETV